jgi:hypothetical protein
MAFGRKPVAPAPDPTQATLALLGLPARASLESIVAAMTKEFNRKPRDMAKVNAGIDMIVEAGPAFQWSALFTTIQASADLAHMFAEVSLELEGAPDTTHSALFDQIVDAEFERLRVQNDPNA